MTMKNISGGVWRGHVLPVYSEIDLLLEAIVNLVTKEVDK
jgi:hypothetical protein